MTAFAISAALNVALQPGEAMPSAKQIVVVLVLVVIGIAIVFRSPLRKIVVGS